MLNDHTIRARIIRAALARAETTGWHGLSLAEIATEAGVSLAEMSKSFAGKAAILEAFQRQVDETVLAKAAPDLNEPARDRVFDVVMTRFEVLAPYKAGLRRIAHDLRGRPGACLRVLCQSTRSQAWMLRAGGIDADGPPACLRVTGLMGVYGQVFAVWLDDDDPGLARTMAALDRRLRRGERWLMRLEGLGGAACRLAAAFRPRRARRPEEEGPRDAEAPDAGGAPEPEPSTG